MYVSGAPIIGIFYGVEYCSLKISFLQSLTVCISLYGSHFYCLKSQCGSTADVEEAISVDT